MFIIWFRFILVAFKSRITQKKFLEEEDDKQLILNIAIYCADHASPAKPS